MYVPLPPHARLLITAFRRRPVRQGAGKAAMGPGRKDGERWLHDRHGRDRRMPSRTAQWPLQAMTILC
jgi:hypothetical protein